MPKNGTSASDKLKHQAFVPEKDRPVAEVVNSNYQPSKAELEQDLRFEGAFEEAARALVQPVNIRQVIKPRS